MDINSVSIRQDGTMLFHLTKQFGRIRELMIEMFSENERFTWMRMEGLQCHKNLREEFIREPRDASAASENDRPARRDCGRTILRFCHAHRAS